ncbi:hypothetical protein F5Y04DRAFT_257252 [Hypomontagnella monticulosa]|nr:hypothetical protein F5Y04DRAFT_257252 [Hypomontagnella monticulosa]
MPFLSTPLTLQATGGILGSAWISGSVAALSICAVPAVLQSGVTAEGLLKGWHMQFSRGMYYIPTTGVFVALNYLYLAYQHSAAGLEWRGYVAGAVSNMMLPVYTLIFINEVNQKMIGANAGTGKALSQEAVRGLMNKWSALSSVRIFMPLAGAMFAMWNLLQ